MSESIQFPHSEADLVRTLNVPRSIIRNLRQQLAEGVDWSREKRRGASEIAWSEKGRAALQTLVLAENAPSEALANAPGHPEKRPDSEILEVVACASAAQPWALPCIGPGASRDRSHWVFVRVAHSAQFVPGMKIRAERGRFGAWTYLGHPDDAAGSRARYPRGRGIW
jgi:hypothetical protein